MAKLGSVDTLPGCSGAGGRLLPQSDWPHHCWAPSLPPMLQAQGLRGAALLPVRFQGRRASDTSLTQGDFPFHAHFTYPGRPECTHHPWGKNNPHAGGYPLQAVLAEQPVPLRQAKAAAGT